MSRKNPPANAATIPVFVEAKNARITREANTRLGTHPHKEKWGRKLTWNKARMKKLSVIRNPFVMGSL